MNANLITIAQLTTLPALLIEQIGPQKTPLKINNTNVRLLIDSGSVCNSAYQKLKNFANEPIPVIIFIQILLFGKCWQIEDAEILVVPDGLILVIGRDLFAALDLSQSNFKLHQNFGSKH